jgi:hypothetical protein
MRSSRGFASTADNKFALFRLAFASAPPQNGLTKLPTVSRRIIMQKARRQAFPLRDIALRPLVGMWFQVHYPPLEGVLPIFRSRYWFAIGHQRVLSLAGWTPQIQTGFHVSGPTQVPNAFVSPAAYGTITLFGRPFQSSSARVLRMLMSGPTTPPGRVPVVWADPLSLAATHGVAFAFFS